MSHRAVLAGLCAVVIAGHAPDARAQRVPTTEIVRLYDEAASQEAEARRIEDTAPEEADRLRQKARSNLIEAIRRDPTYTKAAVLLGRLLLRMERHAEGARLLAATRKRVPDHVEVAMLLGLHLFRAKRAEEAAPHLEAVVKAGKKSAADAAYLLVGHHYRRGQLEAALSYAQMTIAARPREARIHGIIGNIHLRQKRLREAIASFRRVLEIEPDNVAVRVNLGSVFHRLADYPKAIEVLESVRAKRGDLAVVQYNLGSCYYALEQWKRAAERFGSFITLEPQHATGHYYAGVSQVRAGDERQGIPLLVRAGALDPTDPWAPYMLAELAEGRNDLSTAQTFAKTALTRAPRSAKVLLLAGVIARRRKDLAQALAHLIGAQRADSKNARIRAELGYARILAGQTDPGIDDLEAARTLDPEDARAGAWLPAARTRRAVTRAYQGDLPGAEKDLLRALELSPGHREAAWNLALLMDLNDRPKAGLRAVQRALTVAAPAQPGGLVVAPNLHLAAAYLLVRLGRPELAQGELQRATGAGDVGMRLMVQGAIHGHFGEYDEAIAAFKNALAEGIDPGPALVLARLDRIAALMARGRLPRALAELQQLSPQLAPTEARVRAGLLAVALMATRRGWKRIPSLLAVLNAGPVPAGWGLRRLKADRNLALGYIAYRVGREKRAVKLLRKHLSKAPEDKRGRKLLSLVLLDRAERAHASRRYKRAAALVTESLELTGGDDIARHNLAVVQYSRGDHKSAAKTFERLRKAATVPEATLNMALYLDDVAGKGTRALQLYREYVRTGRPASGVAQRRIERKERLYGGK